MYSYTQTHIRFSACAVYVPRYHWKPWYSFMWYWLALCGWATSSSAALCPVEMLLKNDAKVTVFSGPYPSYLTQAGALLRWLQSRHVIWAYCLASAKTQV